MVMEYCQGFYYSFWSRRRLKRTIAETEVSLIAMAYLLVIRCEGRSERSFSYDRSDDNQSGALVPLLTGVLDVIETMGSF